MAYPQVGIGWQSRLNVPLVGRLMAGKSRPQCLSKCLSVQAEQAVHQLPFRPLDQVGMRDTDGMQRAFQLALPEIQELLEAGKERGKIIVLPDELLQQL